MPVTLDGQRIGTVALFSDLEPLYTRLKHGIVVILGVVLASLMAAYLISSRLQRIISLPIYPLLTDAQQGTVIKTLRRILDDLNAHRHKG